MMDNNNNNELIEQLTAENKKLKAEVGRYLCIFYKISRDNTTSEHVLTSWSESGIRIPYVEYHDDGSYGKH